MTSRAFKIQIVGDIKDAKRSLQNMEKSVGKFQSGMTKLAGGMVAAFAVKKVVDFGKAAVARAEAMSTEWGKAGQIIEQTGGVAGHTVDSLKSMTSELSRRTGIDKQLIASGNNVLLTFKGIRNEVGEGNDVFDRASGLMLDMSTVFGGDAKSSATQLAKALEDPIKGVGALARVGVTFTDQQKDMIRELVESGNVLDAQKVILDTLEGQVGGTAEASANATDKLKNVWLDVQEKIGTMILPMLERLSAWAVDVALPAFERFWTFISEAWTNITSLFSGGTSEQLETVQTWARDLFALFKDVFVLIKTIIEKYIAIYSWIWDNFGEQIVAVLKVAWRQVKAIIDLVIGVVGGLVKFVTAILQGDWAAAWDAAKGIIEAFWTYFKKLPGLMIDALRGAVGLVGKAAGMLGKAIINGIIGFWNKLDPRITIGPLPSWIPGIGGKQYQTPDLFPDIPQLASGGIVTGPTVALIGEAGPEAVIPLGSRGGGMGAPQITVNTGVGDPVEIGRAVVDAIVSFEMSAGDSWRTAAAEGY